MCNWFLRGHPVKAVATCARKVRTDAGDCKDNFNAVVTYPGDVQITFGSTQFGQPGIRCRRTLVRRRRQLGVALRLAREDSGQARVGRRAGRSPVAPPVRIRRPGEARGALDEADAEKQKAFVASITGRSFHNEALQGAESALTAMLIRNAAYSGTPLTWDELLTSTEMYDPKISLARLS